MKKIFILLLTLIMVFSLCACQKHECPTCEDLEGEPPEVTTIIYDEEEMYNMLLDSAVGFGWKEEVVDIIVRFVPDFVTLESITSMNDGYQYILLMDDGTDYRMVLGKEGNVVSITYNVEIPTERDIIYIE